MKGTTLYYMYYVLYEDAHRPLPEILYKLLFSQEFYFREFRESGPRKKFHFNLCLFIVMKTSEKSWN